VPALIRTNSQKRGWAVNVFSVLGQTRMARETLLDTGPNSFTEKSIFLRETCPSFVMYTGYANAGDGCDAALCHITSDTCLIKLFEFKPA